MDVIEPHLREEALKRQGSPADSPQNRDPSSSRQPLPPQVAPADQPYQYQINYEARPLDMEAVLSGGGGTPGGGGGSAHKRTRSIDPSQGRGGSPYGSSIGNNPLQPSPYSTASVYRSAKVQESPSDARSSKRRATEGTTPRQRQKSMAAPGSSRKGTPLRQATNGGTPAKPVSSTDPTFSSFVDAATALTGMARAPSDPSLSGSEEDQPGRPQQQSFDPSYSTATNGSHPLPMVHSIPHPPHHYHAFPQPQSHSLSQSQPQSNSFPTNSTQINGHPTNNYLYTSLPLPSSSSTAPARPATPDKTKTPGGGGAGSAENTEVAAADLMLFLAHSPSPVQTRKTQPTLGDGSGIKGRRLFSTGGGGEDSPPVSSSGAAGGLAQSVFGDAFSPSQAPSLSRTTSSPFITSSGPSTSRALDTPFDPTTVEPSKPSSYLSSGLGSAAPIGGLDASAASDAFGSIAPGTPRQRQSSFNGQGWESFINASPSPTRATVPRGDTPPGLGGGGEAAAVA